MNTKFYCEHYNFLNCDSYRLVGYDDFAEDKVPKLDIWGSDIYGEWDTALQLKLFAAIMPVIVSAIHLKRDLYELKLAPFARYDSDIDDMDSQTKLRYAFSSISPKPQAFAGNMKAIEEYFRWYHVERAPYLQDRFTWITLYTQTINIIINLCADFKVEAVIGEFNSDFMPKEIMISDTKLYLLDPALDNQPDDNRPAIKELMVHIEQLLFTKMGVKEVLHPRHYDEEHEIMTDYLDSSIYLRGKTQLLLPYALSPNHAPIEWMDILQHRVFPNICGTLQLWESMASLDKLSRKRHGPGYSFPLQLPSTGVSFEADHLEVSILDEHLEAFLSQLRPLMMNHLADISARKFQCRISEQVLDLAELSSNWITQVRLYLDQQRPTNALLTVSINGLSTFMGNLCGCHVNNDCGDSPSPRDKYGNFYEADNVFKCMKNLDTSTKFQDDHLKEAFSVLIGRYVWTNMLSDVSILCISSYDSFTIFLWFAI